MLYAGLFVVSVTILFGVVFWSAAQTMARQIDQTVSDELAEVRASASSGDILALQSAVTEFAARSPGLRYLLQDDAGHVLAGDLPPIDAVPGARLLSRPDVGKPAGAIRGRGVAVPGGYLFVGANDHELGEMEEAVVRAFGVSLVVTVMLALAGGAMMSLSVLRRVEALGRTSRDIMAGDLALRLPLRGVEDEFDQLATSLNAMLDRIQALMAGLQQVSSDIAHDLRTPLTRVRQRLELARRRADTVDALHTALDGSIGDVDAILRTFAALLRIAQVEAGTRRSGFVELDLSALLGELVEIYQPVAEERGQILTGSVEGPLTMRGDRELILQMFANLIENAMRHTPPRTRIAVTRIAVVGGPATIAVEDDGPGIPAASRAQVFARFHRLEASRTTPGDGLGLSMVAAVAQLHGASVTLQDAGPGLRVAVTFAESSSRPCNSW